MKIDENRWKYTEGYAKFLYFHLKLQSYLKSTIYESLFLKNFLLAYYKSICLKMGIKKVSRLSIDKDTLLEKSLVDIAVFLSSKIVNL